MKLVVLFMLVTIPICCYASGSGCSTVDEVIDKTIDPSVSEDDYLILLSPYIHTDSTRDAVKQFKECFLKQDNETLKNAKLMGDIIYNSESCQESS
ncbi:secretoglobin family 2A member 1-like [Arvicanthis niloticus]|uniref:secretoglobin family 2A member 1-like n=1 Tax=Arvicanthis niloticus TaxID=61156 RepID=UPI001486EA82|nr:secretoglobin family 2A member 1-like [Arvicanthis niloticus]